MFDWENFLNKHRIEYVTQEAANTGRDNISIQCPFCGNSDPSFHMGISLKGYGWNCWRDHSHKGKNPARLVQAILKCSYHEAAVIVGQKHYVPDDFMSQVSTMLSDKPEKENQLPLKVPKEFKKIVFKPSCTLAVNYLRRRGYSTKQISKLDEYDIRFCRTGFQFKDRIIFLIYYNERLVTWTGRSVHASESVRYKSLSTKNEEPPVATRSIKDCLLWYDYLSTYDYQTIYVVEGPFDALRIAVLGEPYGITATCLFGNNATVAQLDLLHGLLPKFSNKYIMLDDAMYHQALGISRELSSINLKSVSVPEGIKDPGEIGIKQLLKVSA